MSTVAIIPRTAGVVIPGAPKVDLSPFYRKVAKLPGLAYMLDPAYLDAKARGRDLKGGALVVPQIDGAITRIAADPAFNNRAVISKGLNSSSLRMIGSRNNGEQWTFLCVAAADAQSAYPDITTGSHNLTVMALPEADPTYSNAGWYFYNGTGGLAQRFQNLSSLPAGAFPSHDTAGGNTPAAGEVALWFASADRATRSVSTLYRKNLFLDYTYAASYVIPPAELYRTAEWNYGGYYNSMSASFRGRMGIGMWFDIPLHLPIYRPIRDEVIGLVKEYYAIPA